MTAQKIKNQNRKSKSNCPHLPILNRWKSTAPIVNCTVLHGFTNTIDITIDTENQIFLMNPSILLIS